MTVVMCTRDPGAGPVLPFRALYGTRDGNLIFPLDLAFTSFNPDQMNPPGPPIMGANILDSGGNVIGTIASYDWPIAGGTVIPSVTANPTPAINLSAVFALPPGPPAQIPIPPGGAVPVQVTNMNGVVVIGTLQGFTTVPYLDFIHQIDVYQAQFDPPLFGEDHGLPVVLANDPSVLVGMVIVTQSNNGAINTFIARI